MENTFGCAIILKKHKKSTTLEAPLYGRITINGKRVEVSLKISIAPKEWDSKKYQSKNRGEKGKTVNRIIGNFQTKARKTFEQLLENNEFVSAESMKNILTGNDVTNKSLIETLDELIEIFEQRVGIDYKESTIKKYRTSRKHLTSFIHDYYRNDDLYLKEIKYTFITNFEHYLKAKKKIGQNSVFKHIQHLRKIMNIGLKNSWIEKDPFVGYKIKRRKVERGFLTQQELEIIEEKTFELRRLNEVKDFFIFSCYTGLAYVDLYNLTKKDINIGIDGEKWIINRRVKTDTRYMIPLLPKALEIINKYKRHPIALNKGKLFPMLSNQKVNAYLKEIANECKIDKNLTFHLARHTFATTVTLTNGVPIETVSKMLGHTNISTTQIYSKVVEQKVSHDMLILKQVVQNLDNNRKQQGAQ